jgi:hypothetical protein
MKAMLLYVRKSFLLLAVIAPYAASATHSDSLGTSGKQNVWEFAVSGFYYAFPTDDDVLMAVGRADWGNLHLEARYNYEDLKTGSLFTGRTLSAGESFTIDLTPLAGVAFGQTTGIVPALEASLGYGMFDFYVEGEYLFDLNDDSGNFFYSWLELAVAPTDHIRTGLAAQRTRIFQSPLEVDRGVFAQLTPEFGSASVYAFNLFTDSWFLVVGVEIAW